MSSASACTSGSSLGTYPGRRACRYSNSSIAVPIRPSSGHGDHTYLLRAGSPRNGFCLRVGRDITWRFYGCLDRFRLSGRSQLLCVADYGFEVCRLQSWWLPNRGFFGHTTIHLQGVWDCPHQLHRDGPTPELTKADEDSSERVGRCYLDELDRRAPSSRTGRMRSTRRTRPATAPLPPASLRRLLCIC